MEKKIAFIVCTLLSVCSFAQIPNAGFESWTNMGGYENPDNWGTMNNSTAFYGVFTAERATFLGESFIKLSSKSVNKTVVSGIAVSGKLDSITRQPKSGFAYTGRPISLNGIWQYMAYGGYPGSISAALTKWNSSSGQRDTIADAYQSLPGMVMVWLPFSIPFSYRSGNTPDSCIIFLQASGAIPVIDDYLWLDSLAFAGTASSVTGQGNFITGISAYPNPAKKDIEVAFCLVHPEKVSISLINMNGELIKESDLGVVSGSATYSFNINGISKGAYFIHVIAENGTEVKKIVIE